MRRVETFTRTYVESERPLVNTIYACAFCHGRFGSKIEVTAHAALCRVAKMDRDLRAVVSILRAERRHEPGCENSPCRCWLSEDT